MSKANTLLTVLSLCTWPLVKEPQAHSVSWSFHVVLGGWKLLTAEFRNCRRIQLYFYFGGVGVEVGRLHLILRDYS